MMHPLQEIHLVLHDRVPFDVCDSEFFTPMMSFTVVILLPVVIIRRAVSIGSAVADSVDCGLVVVQTQRVSDKDQDAAPE